MEHVVIIGGGGTGAALAHDLTLRGLGVTLLERGEPFSGATGRHHGLLHSGARYAVHDPEAARECAEENAILRRIAPHALERTGGLFVALDDEDLAYREAFLEGCAASGVPARQLDAAEARRIEPALAEGVRLAVAVEDATIDPYRLPLSFLAAAKAGGARVRAFCPVTEVLVRGRAVAGVRLRDLASGREEEVGADLVVNAAGAWAGRVAALAGLEVPVQPGPGVMVAVRGRLVGRVLNRLRPAAEGDIVLPQRKLTVLGTSLWLADDPDVFEPPAEHVRRMVELCSAMAPALATARVHAAWCAARPLIADPTKGDAQALSRTFDCFDHGVRDGLAGLFSVIGGKATTLRAMAELAADRLSATLGRELPCRTRETPLPSWRAFHAGGAR